MSDWLSNDELFKAELEEGQRWERWFAAQLEQAGIYTFMPVQRMRKPDKSDISKFANQKDVIFGRFVSRWIEVKSRNVEFNGVEDFPYESIFVCTEADWAVKKPKPTAIAVISRKTKQVIIIPGGTRPSWRAQRKFDRVRKIHETFLEAPKSVCISFDEFLAWARQQEGV